MYLPTKLIIALFLFIVALFSGVYIYYKYSVKVKLVDCEKFIELYNNCLKSCVNYTEITLTERCDTLDKEKGIYDIMCIDRGKCIITPQ